VVEQGFVMLVQAALGTPPMAPGGYAVQLPSTTQIGDGTNGTYKMAWTYNTISDEPSYTLGGQDGLTEWEFRLNCHGSTMANAITLARAIDGVLRGSWAGVLPDPDATVVQGIFRRAPVVDGFDDVNRSYVRTLEYMVQYEQI
jgi:hypothetical protein